MGMGESRTAFMDEAGVLAQAAEWWATRYGPGAVPPWAGDMLPFLDAASGRDPQAAVLAQDIRRIRDEQWAGIEVELVEALAGTDVGRDVAAARRREFLSPSLAIRALTSVSTTLARATLLKRVEQWVASWQASPIDPPDQLWADVVASSLGVAPGPGGRITYGATLRGLEHRAHQQRQGGHDGTGLRHKLLDVRSMQYTALARRFTEVLAQPGHEEAARVWAGIGPSERGASGMILTLTMLCPNTGPLVDALVGWWRFWYVD